MMDDGNMTGWPAHRCRYTPGFGLMRKRHGGGCRPFISPPTKSAKTGQTPVVSTPVETPTPPYDARRRSASRGRLRDSIASHRALLPTRPTPSHRLLAPGEPIQPVPRCPRCLRKSPSRHVRIPPLTLLHLPLVIGQGIDRAILSRGVLLILDAGKGPHLCGSFQSIAFRPPYLLVPLCIGQTGPASPLRSLWPAHLHLVSGILPTYHDFLHIRAQAQYRGGPGPMRFGPEKPPIDDDRHFIDGR